MKQANEKQGAATRKGNAAQAMTQRARAMRDPWRNTHHTIKITLTPKMRGYVEADAKLRHVPFAQALADVAFSELARAARRWAGFYDGNPSPSFVKWDAKFWADTDAWLAARGA